MRKRNKSTPRLEMMEGRIAPSFLGMNMPPSLSADFNKIGNSFKSGANSLKSEVEKLNQNRPGQSVAAQWGRNPNVTHHSGNTLFGIPWLKI